eukprot:Plantae.Rhodophyta-Purpureofilum_apyrenoidigerum.ctg4980.p1 GENE.Plantae.Rhodophyta-Purpureofilum_apyrenoidigerum.ctg4980~~Plantae.Rhodophyta-Purpureofilum_apyrenoidigerum.ctg4980.p1  ORF type:complete len:205 (-),score=42.60 Plantae.Rhodophyta-Purpureofilum_apyrenoidigerum.ctg4980:478-1092(-)
MAFALLSTAPQAHRHRARMCATRAGQKKVLFVCLGNICRSPTAEAMFKNVVEREGRTSQFEVDSCGTGGGNPDWFMEEGWSYHEGDSADSRMQETAARRGIKLTSKSRPLKREDLESFDYILAMDENNVREIMRAAKHWGDTSHSLAREKTSLMLDFAKEEKLRGKAVPDPYYGGPEGFEKVLDLLDDASEGLLNHIDAEILNQ